MSDVLSDIDLDELEKQIEEAPTKVSKKKAETARSEDFPELHPTQIKRDLAFDHSNMDESYISQAGLYFHYAEVSARVNRLLEDTKLRLGILEAEIYTELRDEAEKSKQKITEALLDKKIKLDLRYRRMSSKLNNVRHLAAIAKETLEAFKQKRDMLIQKGADIREEMKGSLYLSTSERIEEKKKAAMQRMAKEA